MRRTRDRPQHHELIERQLAVVPMAAGDAELLFDIGGRQQLRVLHQFADAGRVLLEHRHDGRQEALPCRQPSRP